MSHKIELSFITINYNGIKDTIELIESIHSTIKSVHYEIIVVDNASQHEEGKLLKEKYPDITVIQSKKNTGFSGGNNLGIKAAKGNYLFFINNDTYFVDDQIIHLIHRVNLSNTTGGVSPKIKFADPPQNIQYAGFTELSPITLRNNTIGLGEADSPIYNQAKPTPYLHGAAMMIKREVIETVGLMPEIYFLYYEELDWSSRMNRKGYELWYEPLCTIYHKESQSTGKESKLQVFYHTRNRLLYAWRNLTGMALFLSILYQMTIVFPKNCLSFILKRQATYIATAVKGISAFTTLRNKRNNEYSQD